MKIWIHKDSRLKDILHLEACEYNTLDELEKLPDDTLQIIPLIPDETTFLDYIKKSQANIVLENPFEGSNTFVRMLENAGLLGDALKGRYATICTGEMPEGIKNCNLQYMLYLTGLKNEHQRHIMFGRHERPFTFLYLNNRIREHRVALVNEMAKMELLDNALWSHISSGRKLPSEYDLGREITHDTLVDWKQWEAGLMVEKQHFDTYFSVQAESTVKLRYSMFSEKTWKPILGEHPFATLSGANHYKDLKKMGFETFDHVFGSDWHELEPWESRMKGMVMNIANVVGSDLHDIMFDAETRRQARHNVDHFWKWYDNYAVSATDKLCNFLEEIYPDVEAVNNRWKPNPSFELVL